MDSFEICPKRFGIFCFNGNVDNVLSTADPKYALNPNAFQNVSLSIELHNSALTYSEVTCVKLISFFKFFEAC